MTRRDHILCEDRLHSLIVDIKRHLLKTKRDSASSLRSSSEMSRLTQMSYENFHTNVQWSST